MSTFNKCLSVSDYSRLSPDQPFTRRKPWEITMSLRALEAHGAIRQDAEILGVGAGNEPTIYNLSTRVKRVFATDLYYNPGVWSKSAPSDMLTNPERYAPADTPCDLRRIVVQHMDGRNLRYPDNTFDGIFSTGSIEHFGDYHDIHRAAREMRRVLKPGGICVLATEFKIYGDGIGLNGTLLFTASELIEHIIEPSGLEPVDEPQFIVDEETRITGWPLDSIIQGNLPPIEGALIAEGFLFTSVHLALRKPL